MSEFISYRKINSIAKHPNADNLAILQVGKFTVIHNLEEANKLKVGQIVAHFPTDICIDPEKAVELGVDKYLRDAQYKNGEKAKCRIVAARLRGIPSYGFISLDRSIWEQDLDTHYGVYKYEPPIPLNLAGDIERTEHSEFPRYTKIKRIQLYPNAWKDGTQVRITEKIHGTNIRLGVVRDTHDGDWRFMVGSHYMILKEFNSKGIRNKYWNMLSENVMELLNDACNEEVPVVIYGEMFGRGIQDLDYGYENPELRIYDIKVDGVYIDWDEVKQYCEKYEIRTVPELFIGSFSWCSVNHFTDGGSVVNHPSRFKSVFKGREGIVITPLKETYSPILNDRLIAKSISVDYESRHGGTEFH